MKPKRFYTNKSHRIKERVYWTIAIILFPVWTPFYLLSWVGYILLTIGENICVFFDKALENILGKLIPQFKD